MKKQFVKFENFSFKLLLFKFLDLEGLVDCNTVIKLINRKQRDTNKLFV